MWQTLRLFVHLLANAEQVLCGGTALGAGHWARGTNEPRCPPSGRSRWPCSLSPGSFIPSLTWMVNVKRGSKQDALGAPIIYLYVRKASLRDLYGGVKFLKIYHDVTSWLKDTGFSSGAPLSILDSGNPRKQNTHTIFPTNHSLGLCMEFLMTVRFLSFRFNQNSLC